MLTPEALATLTVIAAVGIGSHWIGVGEVVDVVLIGWGVWTLGPEVRNVGRDLHQFVTLATHAQTDRDIDRAADHFARAIAVIGVDGLAAILLHKSFKAIRTLRGGALGPARVSEGVAVDTEGSALKTINETPYESAVKILDLGFIKKEAAKVWQQPRKWPVKVFKLRAGQRVGDPVMVDGYFTTELSVAGASLRELEQRMGLESGYLGDAAAIVRLDRLPLATEFDIRFYNNIDGGGVKPADPRFPRGPGYPQWELLQKIRARITHIISK